MPTLDERFDRAVAELDDILGSPTLRTTSEFRHRQRRRRLATATTTTGLAIVGIGGLVIVSAMRHDRGPAPVAEPAATSASTNAAPESERVRIGSDLFDTGYGWLDGRNFAETRVGPFMVYESDVATEPSYWYYKGVGIVPIGTKYDVRMGGESSTEESAGG
jgi:hypothetical protein